MVFVYSSERFSLESLFPILVYNGVEPILDAENFLASPMRTSSEPFQRIDIGMKPLGPTPILVIY